MRKKQQTMEELLEEALVPEEEQPYQVPDNWIWIRLEHSKKDEESFGDGDWILSENIDPNGEVRLIQLSDIGQGEFLNKSSRYISEKTFEALGCKEILPGDILISRMAHPIARSCVVPDLGQKLITAVDIAFIRTNEELINKKYLNYMFNTVFFRKQAESLARGTTRLRITRKNLGRLAIPIPPLCEQKRTTDKVERLLSKIDEAKRLIEEAKETFELRRAAVLDKAFRGELTRKWREQHPEIESAEVLYNKIIRFTKPKNVSSNVEQKLNIPDTWKMVRLGEVVQVNPPKKKLEEISDQQICTFVPMPAVSDKTGKIESPEEKEYAKVKKGYTFFLENDVLFAKITPCMENGKSAIAKNLKNGFGFGSTEFHVLRTNEYINERYLHYLVRSKKFRLEAKGEMTGAVGQQRVPKEFLVNYPFPLPPKEEQDAIVDILDEIFTRDDIAYRIIETKYELETLKQSILSKAFRGELGTNDPTEESAIGLLKEVLKEQVK
ncbi:restriction endonuclease subunit S [Heyndrickxia coagulans]|uniref:restriction endonuclease subunit S n=1 Tax=Heyndrickxia coagulans TaxID=1398 RepID=UPI00047C517D|nr:restriction endonuclease subunit S [Heyndrickxia coagulans]